MLRPINTDFRILVEFVIMKSIGSEIFATARQKVVEEFLAILPERNMMVAVLKDYLLRLMVDNLIRLVYGENQRLMMLARDIRSHFPGPQDS